MTNRHQRRGGRTTPKGSRPSSYQAGSPGSRQGGRPHRARPDRPPFIDSAQAALAEGSPFLLLTLASSLVEATTPRPFDSFPGQDVDRPDAASVFLSFTDPQWPALGALALAAATLHPDGVLARRIRLALDPSVVIDGPAWLASIDRITITETIIQTHLLGDGDNILIGWSWPGGQCATAVVYIDHNVGTLVKDAFAVEGEVGEMLASYREVDDGNMRFDPIDPADARARIEEAIERADQTVPPFESDTWPSSRPLVEWLVRQLPSGGTGHIVPEWPEEERQRLLEDFVGSADGAIDGLTAAEVGRITESLLWFGCDYGPGDPLRWSPVSVEIVLADWFPRKVFGLQPELMARVPDVLLGFIRFAGSRRDTPADLIDETLSAVDTWRPGFVAAVAKPGRTPTSAAARLARLAAGLDPDVVDPDLVDPGGLRQDEGSVAEALAALGVAFDLDELDVDLDDLDDDLFDNEEYSDPEAYMADVVESLEASVIELAGGPAAYATVDAVPLTEVAFDWSLVGDEQRESVAITLKHLDRWSTELFDGEVRTIARAVLAGVVAADPGLAARSDRSEGLAAAVLAFLLDRLTGRLSAREARDLLSWQVFTVAELARATGVSAQSIRSRAKTVAMVALTAVIAWPSILHSTQRQEILHSKQLIADWRADHPED